MSKILMLTLQLQAPPFVLQINKRLWLTHRTAIADIQIQHRELPVFQGLRVRQLVCGSLPEDISLPHKDD